METASNIRKFSDIGYSGRFVEVEIFFSKNSPCELIKI